MSAYASDVSSRPPFTGTADVPRVLAEWEAGATIVLQALHVNWHPLAVFCRLLEGALGYGVQANAYYTPRTSQGFGVHHDTHDVLVTQVARARRRGSSTTRSSSCRSSTSATRLSASTARRPSSRTDRDTLLPAARLAPRSGDVRHGLAPPDDRDRGPHRHRRARGRADRDSRARSRSARLGRRRRRGARPPRRGLDPERVEERRRQRFVDTRRPMQEDGLTQLRALAGLDASTRVEQRETVIADLDEDDDRLALVFEGKELRFPPHAAAQAAGLLRERGAVRGRRPARRAGRRRPARPPPPPRARRLPAGAQRLSTRCAVTT